MYVQGSSRGRTALLRASVGDDPPEGPLAGDLDGRLPGEVRDEEVHRHVLAVHQLVHLRPNRRRHPLRVGVQVELRTGSR